MDELLHEMVVAWVYPRSILVDIGQVHLLLYADMWHGGYWLG
jgi:hypothetical protein